MNKKNVGIAFGALCGLAALTATAAEIFYDISINTKSPIHMSKLNNLVQKPRILPAMKRKQVQNTAV